jgi:hypothetical protein
VLPLAAGVSFGVGYGLTDRLLSLGQGGTVRLEQSFDVKPFPGTSLESLRLRYGADRKELRANPELIEQERTREQDRGKPKDQARREPEPAAAEPEARERPAGESGGADDGSASGAARDSQRPEPSETSSPPVAPPPPPAPDRQP